MAIAVLAMLGSLATPARAESLPELQRCVARPELWRGATGGGVKCLQFTLIMMGYPVQYTGVYDQATEDAIRWFQAVTPPLVADGRAGEQTLVLLGIDATTNGFPLPAKTETAATDASMSTAPSVCLADAQIDPNERGVSVTCLQKRLTELGYYTATVSGLHDQASVAAVKAFQKATPPLLVDGRAGPRTLAALGIWSGITTGNGRATGPGPFPAPVQNEAFWNLTAQGVPFYNRSTACTPSEAAVIAAEFANDGADAATQQWAVYIASREGGCRFDAVNINARTKDDSHCTFQLNVLSGMFEPHGALGRRGWTPDMVKASLDACADAASDLWVYCGRGPWTPPYSCTPPWDGATVGQPAANLPTTTTTEPPPSSSLPFEPPVPSIPVPTVPSAPAVLVPVNTTTTTVAG
ncbi:MAG: peptidoglycan-binding protein [Actinobacteria bacterium]|nr:peptidoglycan-binding protein [Actinomycetota bacterium]